MKLEWVDQTIPNPHGPAVPISTSITGAETDTLTYLAGIHRRALEIGSAYGYSTIVLALAGDHVTAVDPHAWLPSWEVFDRNLHTYQVRGRVDVWRYGAETALPDMINLGRRYGLVFIDGDHEQAAVHRDVILARQLLLPGGILACHDWDEDTCPGVRAALEPLLGQPDSLVDTLAIYRGLA